MLQPEYYAISNSYGVRGAILEPTTSTSDGVWHDLQGVHPVSVTVEGDFDGSAIVCVSNYPTLPDNTWHGAPLGTIISAGGGARTVDMPYRWVKVRVLSYVTGTITAYAFGFQVGRRAG